MMAGDLVALRALAPVPVLYINRDKDNGRRQFIEEQLSRLSFEGGRVQAVEGYNLPPDLAPYFFHAVTGKTPMMAAGEVGCYASHLRVWKQIVLEQAPAVLVLEDDAILDEQLPTILRQTLDCLPAGWDLVHLSLTTRRHAERPLAELPCGRTLVRFSRIPSTTAGYLISLKGAGKLLDPSILRFWPVDTDIRQAWLFNLDVYGLTAPPIRQSGALPSVILQTGTAKKKRASDRRGLPRPTAYSWSNAPLRSPRSLLFNLRKLGPVWWLRCLAANCARKIGTAWTPIGRLASAAVPALRRA